jgi:hypothetical protein
MKNEHKIRLIKAAIVSRKARLAINNVSVEDKDTIEKLSEIYEAADAEFRRLAKKHCPDNRGTDCVKTDRLSYCCYSGKCAIVDRN